MAALAVRLHSKLAPSRYRLQFFELKVFEAHLLVVVARRLAPASASPSPSTASTATPRRTPSSRQFYGRV